MLPFMHAESCRIKKLGSDVGVKITRHFGAFTVERTLLENLSKSLRELWLNRNGTERRPLKDERITPY